ncbi:RNA polymerase sigma factor [Angustibacter sp. McL0619]|uniref:RNA polymerase sigma factor n=1 Tax=Angustibacter sp. McL0619 TaxID=3415676 RepID=UPI003CE775E9
MEDVVVLAAAATAEHAEAVETADALLTRLFEEEGATLVRLARFFVDDRAAAEDLVQEAFIRLSRALSRVRQPDNARAYLRAIVLNLARDHNRRGLMSLRHRPPADPEPASVEEQVAVRDDARRVVAALGRLPRRQRDCLVLRYYLELPVAEVASTLGLSVNSVKTHLKRGLRGLENRLEERTAQP